VEVRSSGIEGRGLFACAPIAAGDVVMVLGGYVMADDEFLRVSGGMSKYSAATIGENLNILLDDDTPVQFGNHSCDANLWMQDEVTIVARRDIAPGEEITVDYATHTADKPWQMPCRCGASVCRGVITQDDWRLPDVQERYAGHFSPFLNARIASLRAVR
jgi:SET domain-containing protein